ncbi:MAG: Cupin 2 conserved barrel domain protein [Thermoleophilia bacterium]|nr:Cupin 2 conserved barrel domain protein [Thermoleophilia bacterium]
MTARGNGWASTTLDELGSGPGMRKLRTELHVTAFGINGMVLAPGTAGRWHWHDEQQEVYIVLRGELTIEFEHDAATTIGPGGVACVESSTIRRLYNAGDVDVELVALGGKDGYVGRDGNLRDDELERLADGEQGLIRPAE